MSNTISKIIGAELTPYAKFDSVKPRSENSAYVGLEVEVENTSSVRAGNRGPWMIKGDGSLRNDGIEIVSLPIAAEHVPLALDVLYDKIITPSVSFSMRTSIHVHLNVLDLTSGQVKQLVSLYTIFEPLLFAYVGRGRWKSVFCVPLKDCDQLTSLSQLPPQAIRWNKYTALNLSRLRDLGTVEFRHMCGTFNREKITNWIGIITKLRDYVIHNKGVPIPKLFEQMDKNFNFTEFTSTVFEEYTGILPMVSPEALYEASLAARVPYCQSHAMQPMVAGSRLAVALKL